MNVVDSSGWVEYFAAGPFADFYAHVIEATDELIVPTITIYEVYKTIARRRGEDNALTAIMEMHQGHVVELTAPLAVNAATLSLDSQLPMADAIILATARKYSATLWTQDAHFDGLDGVMSAPRV
ncbi:type II toxin-antitoxin system VapC family toxin [bacterium]|nr:type II toxin-antitoxin system VapC family toxin [bacterium]